MECEERKTILILRDITINLNISIRTVKNVLSNAKATAVRQWDCGEPNSNRLNGWRLGSRWKSKGKDHKLCDLYPMIFLLNQRVQTQK